MPKRAFFCDQFQWNWVSFLSFRQFQWNWFKKSAQLQMKGPYTEFTSWNRVFGGKNVAQKCVFLLRQNGFFVTSSQKLLKIAKCHQKNHEVANNFQFCNCFWTSFCKQIFSLWVIVFFDVTFWPQFHPCYSDETFYRNRNFKFFRKFVVEITL